MSLAIRGFDNEEDSQRLVRWCVRLVEVLGDMAEWEPSLVANAVSGVDARSFE